MTERPILFSGAMVRAILGGEKTQTRRPVKPQPESALKWLDESRCMEPENGVDPLIAWVPIGKSGAQSYWRCPYGVPGNRLWVREKGWQRPERSLREMREGADTWKPYYFDADGLTKSDHDQFKAWGFKRRPSIHMPHCASRIILEVTAVRVERLQEINEDDARAEGCALSQNYMILWDLLNAKRAPWSSNPWVWVIGFRRVRG